MQYTEFVYLYICIFVHLHLTIADVPEIWVKKTLILYAS